MPFASVTVNLQSVCKCVLRNPELQSQVFCTITNPNPNSNPDLNVKFPENVHVKSYAFHKVFFPSGPLNPLNRRWFSRLLFAYSPRYYTFFLHSRQLLWLGYFKVCLRSKNVKVRIALNDWKPITELQTVTCHMGSHSVTCHLTQVNVPRLNPSRASRYSIYLPWRDGRLSWPRCWLYTEMVYLSTDSRPSR